MALSNSNALAICPKCLVVHSDWVKIIELDKFICNLCSTHVTTQYLLMFNEDYMGKSKKKPPHPPAKHSDHVHATFAMNPSDVQGGPARKEPSQFSSRDTVYAGMTFGFDKPASYYEQRLIELQKKLEAQKEDRRRDQTIIQQLRKSKQDLKNRNYLLETILVVSSLVMEQIQDESYGDDLESLESKDRDTFTILDALQDALSDYAVQGGKLPQYKKGAKDHSEPDYGLVYAPYLELVPVEPVEPDDDQPFEAHLLGFSDNYASTHQKATLSDVDKIVKEVYAPAMQEQMKESANSLFAKHVAEHEKLIEKTVGLSKLSEGSIPITKDNNNHFAKALDDEMSKIIQEMKKDIWMDLSTAPKTPLTTLAGVIKGGIPVVSDVTMPKDLLLFINSNLHGDSWYAKLGFIEGQFVMDPEFLRHRFEEAFTSVPHTLTIKHVKMHPETFNLLKIAFTF